MTVSIRRKQRCRDCGTSFLLPHCNQPWCLVCGLRDTRTPLTTGPQPCTHPSDPVCASCCDQTPLF